MLHNSVSPRRIEMGSSEEGDRSPVTEIESPIKDSLPLISASTQDAAIENGDDPHGILADSNHALAEDSVDDVQDGIEQPDDENHIDLQEKTADLEDKSEDPEDAEDETAGPEDKSEDPEAAEDKTELLLNGRMEDGETLAKGEEDIEVEADKSPVLGTGTESDDKDDLDSKLFSKRSQEEQALANGHTEDEIEEENEPFQDSLPPPEVEGVTLLPHWIPKPCLHVTGLGGVVSKEELTSLLSEHGEVSSIIFENEKRESAIIRFEPSATENEDIIEKVQKVLVNAEINNRTLVSEPFRSDSLLFIGNLTPDIDDAHLRKMFEPHGTLERAFVLLNSEGKSKGYGFVEYSLKSQASAAKTAMGNINMDGRVLRVEWSDCKKVSEMFSTVLFVDRIPKGIHNVEGMLRNLFGKHGRVKDCHLVIGFNQQFRGFGFIDFYHSSFADKAHQALDGYEVDGSNIRVSFANPSKSAQSYKSRFSSQTEPTAGFGGRSSYAGLSSMPLVSPRFLGSGRSGMLGFGIGMQFGRGGPVGPGMMGQGLVSPLLGTGAGMLGAGAVAAGMMTRGPLVLGGHQRPGLPVGGPIPISSAAIAQVATAQARAREEEARARAEAHAKQSYAAHNVAEYNPYHRTQQQAYMGMAPNSGSNLQSQYYQQQSHSAVKDHHYGYASYQTGQGQMGPQSHQQGQQPYNSQYNSQYYTSMQQYPQQQQQYYQQDGYYQQQQQQQQQQPQPVAQATASVQQQYPYERAYYGQQQPTQQQQQQPTQQQQHQQQQQQQYGQQYSQMPQQYMQQYQSSIQGSQNPTNAAALTTMSQQQDGTQQQTYGYYQQGNRVQTVAQTTAPTQSTPTAGAQQSLEAQWAAYYAAQAAHQQAVSNQGYDQQQQQVYTSASAQQQVYTAASTVAASASQTQLVAPDVGQKRTAEQMDSTAYYTQTSTAVPTYQQQPSAYQQPSTTSTSYQQQAGGEVMGYQQPAQTSLPGYQSQGAATSSYQQSATVPTVAGGFADAAPASSVPSNYQQSSTTSSYQQPVQAAAAVSMYDYSKRPRF